MTRLSALSFALLVTIVVGAIAQTPQAPAQLVAIISAGGGGDTYDVTDAATGRSCTVSTPTAPTISSSQTVNTSTLATHIGTNGVRLTLQAGSYGAQTISANDQEWILQDGAILGDINITGSRIIIRSENTRQGEVSEITGDGLSTDVLLYELEINGTGADENIFAGDRYAVVSNVIRMNEGYHAYVDQVSDFIWANNDSETTGTPTRPGVRIMSSNDTLVVDSRIAMPPASQQALRYHADAADSDNHCADNNQIEGSPGQIQANSGGGAYMRLITVTYTNSVIYGGDGANWGSMGTGDQRCEVLTMTGNTMYSTGGAFPSQLLPAWTVTPNTLNATASAPAWSFN